MKIGILTFVNAINYGALFQMISLWDYINNAVDEDVELINYDSKRIKSQYYLRLKKSVGTWREYVQLNYDALKRIPKVVRFRRLYGRINISKKVNRREILQNELNYGKIIVGSDQVWNSAVTQADDVYYLPMIDSENAPLKYSYAASLGNDKSIQGYQKDVVEYIRDFRIVSVRESDSCIDLEQKYNIHSKVVLDPVFLNSKEYWEKLASDVRNRQDIVLVYNLMNYDTMYECLNNYPNKENKTFIVVTKNARMDRVVKQRLKRKGIRHILKSNMSPQDFLGHIKSAEMVITDSFHATALSIILNRNFISLLNTSNNTGNTNGRLNSLLRLVGLEDRIYRSDYSLLSNSIDYQSVLPVLDEAINSSRSVLDDILADGESFV